MTKHYNTAISIEIDVMIGDDSAFKCSVPFQCIAWQDDEPDPTKNDSDVVVTLQPNYIPQLWVGSLMLEKAREQAVIKFTQYIQNGGKI